MTTAPSLPASPTTRKPTSPGFPCPAAAAPPSWPSFPRCRVAQPGTAAPMKTSHLFTNVLINLDGDEAEARSRAAVYSVRGTPEQVRVRGISYRDRMRRTPDGWRIAKRVHSVAWEGAMESVPITPIAPQSEEQ